MGIDTPPVPPGMDAFAVQRSDGTETYAVSPGDAARLIGRRIPVVHRWIRSGVVDICDHPAHGKLVLIDSLWAALPEELRRES